MHVFVGWDEPRAALVRELHARGVAQLVLVADRRLLAHEDREAVRHVREVREVLTETGDLLRLEPDLYAALERWAADLRALRDPEQ